MLKAILIDPEAETVSEIEISTDWRDISKQLHCKIFTTVDINGQLKMNNREFIMYDVYGREVKKLSIVNYPFSIQRGDLPSGIYFYKLSNSTEVFGTGKIVIE